MEPKFSVIIPVYNVAPWLQECLDSLLSQTFGNWEAICVNDGSADASGAILDSYAKKDSRFRVFHQRNKGVSSARNLALDNARGEWIVFLDGDDVYNKGLLCGLEETLKLQVDLSLINFEYARFDENQVMRWPDSLDGSVEVCNADCLKSSRRFKLSFCNKAYCHALIGGVRFADFAHGEDSLFVVQYMRSVKCVAFLPMVGYGYRARKGSATQAQWDRKRFFDRMGVCRAILNCASEVKDKIHSDALKNTFRELTGDCILRIVRSDPSMRNDLWLRWHNEIALLDKSSLSWWDRCVTLPICKKLKIKAAPILLYMFPHCASRFWARIKYQESVYRKRKVK